MSDLKLLKPAITWPYRLIAHEGLYSTALLLFSLLLVWVHILLVYPFLFGHLEQALSIFEIPKIQIARTVFFTWLLLFLLIFPFFLSAATLPSIRLAGNAKGDLAKSVQHLFSSYLRFLESLFKVLLRSGVVILGPVAIVFSDFYFFQNSEFTNYRLAYWVCMGFIFMFLLYKSMTHLLHPLCASLFVAGKRESYLYSQITVASSGLCILVLSILYALAGVSLVILIPHFDIQLPYLRVPGVWLLGYFLGWLYLSSLSCVVIRSVQEEQIKRQENPQRGHSVS
jgi:hypothetical protein